MALFAKKKKSTPTAKDVKEAIEVQNLDENIPNQNNGEGAKLSPVEAFRKKLHDKQERARNSKIKSQFQ